MSNPKDRAPDQLPQFIPCVTCTMPVDVADHDESTVCPHCKLWVCRYCEGSGMHREKCKGVQ